MPQSTTFVRCAAQTVLALLGICGTAAGQSIGGRTLLATVVDDAGRSMVDFDSDDFVISEGGESRDVLEVHVADYPVALVVDDGAGPALGAIRASVARFIDRIGDRPVAIIRLSDPSRPISSLEDERTSVLESVKGLSPSDAPPQPLSAIATAARVLHETGAPFSAIVIVSGKRVDARQLVESSPLPEILESGATVHGVVVNDQARERADDQEVPDLFRVIADQTHGQYTAIFSSASYSIALDRLADRLSAELMVNYLVPLDERSPNVQVGVRRPGARVVGLGVSK